MADVLLLSCPQTLRSPSARKGQHEGLSWDAVTSGQQAQGSRDMGPQEQALVDRDPGVPEW